VGDQPKATGGKPVKYQQVKIEQTELYDLASDVGETKNVADKNPAELSRLLAIADAMRGELGDSLTKTKPTAAREPGKAEPVK
jgi:hypothetical protein